MSEGNNGENSARDVCDIADPTAKITCMKEMDAIEESRDKRKLRAWVIRFAMLASSVIVLLITGGGLYGWLYKDKSFFDGVLGTYFGYVIDIAKIVFGI